MSEDVAEIVQSLTKSEALVIKGGVTWSGQQRNRLIDKGIAPETCRGARPLPRQSRYHACSYALPLTPLGLAVRVYLENDRG